MKKQLVILASKSPRRKALLKQMGIPFKTVISSADERTDLKRPSAIVKKLALKKALNIAEQFPNIPVIGADTLVVCRGRIIGKPENTEDALEILTFLNNSWQTVYTGIAVVWKSKDRILCDYETSLCKAVKLTSAQLNKLAGKHLDKAGAYAVQDRNDPLIKKIIGSSDNVVGLPCKLLKKLLRHIGCH